MEINEINVSIDEMVHILQNDVNDFKVRFNTVRKNVTPYDRKYYKIVKLDKYNAYNLVRRMSQISFIKMFMNSEIADIVCLESVDDITLDKLYNIYKYF